MRWDGRWKTGWGCGGGRSRKKGIGWWWWWKTGWGCGGGRSRKKGMRWWWKTGSGRLQQSEGHFS